MPSDNSHDNHSTNNDMPESQNGGKSSSNTSSTRDKGSGQYDKKSSPALGFLGDAISGNVPKDSASK